MHFRGSLSASVSILVLLGAGAVQAQPQPVQVELQQITIEGEDTKPPEQGAPGVVETEGFVTKKTRSGTKTNTPLLEVPQSISTVTQKQLEDRKPQALLDALNYVPGARTGAFGFDPRYDSFTVRGIDLTYTGVFRDGLRQINSPNGLFRLEPYGLEAINVLKGPSSAIYGASSTGGIVDLITKRPLDYDFREIELQTGSYDRIQGAFDISGRATEDGSLLYRLTGLARSAGTEIDAVDDDRVYIAPAFTWQGENTKLTLLSEYMDSTTGGTVAYINTYDGSNSTGATREFGGDGRFNEFRQKQGRIGWEFEHRFSDVFTLHQNTRYSQLETNQEYIFGGYPGLVQEDTGGIVSDTYLVSNFQTGAVSHQVLTGVDVSYLDYTSWAGYGYTTAFPPDIDDQIDDFEQTQTLVGLYMQDQMEIGPWRVLLGGRHDWHDSDFSGTTTIDGTPPTVSAVDESQSDGKFTGRAALSYITEWNIAPYISYGTSFTPNPGTVIDGSVAVPTTGEQIEVGVKYDLPNANATLRAAVFDLKQEDAVIYAVVSGINRQTQLDLTSRGFEIEATASLAEGFNVIASYAYTDVEIDRLTAETEGNTLSSVPYHMWSIWADYQFDDGFAKGLGVAAGVRYVGSSFGDNLNRPILDNEPRTLVDASIRYDLVNLDPSLEGMRLQVNATNLLDEVKQVCSSNFCYWDEGRKVIASLRYRW